MTHIEVLEQCEREWAERLDPLDLPGSMTDREKQAYTEETARRNQHLVNVRYAVGMVSAALSTISHVEVRSATLDVWDAFRIPARKRLCDELLALPRYLRERSERELQQNVELSIDTLDRGPHILPGSFVYSLKGLRLGDLMIEAGLIDPNNESLRQFSFLKWGGSSKDVERERKTLAQEKIKAQAEYAQVRAYLDRLIAAESAVTS